MNFNKSFLGGHLTKDPVTKFVPSGTAVTNFGLAVNNSYTGKDGNKREDVLFIECVAFGKRGETIAQYLKKGSAIFIEGALTLNTWEKDGVKHSQIKLKVDNFQFIGAKSGSGDTAPAPVDEPGSNDCGF